KIDLIENMIPPAPLTKGGLDSPLGQIPPTSLNKGGLSESPLIKVYTEPSRSGGLRGDQIVYTAVAKNQGIEELETAILKSVNMGDLKAGNMEFAINQRQTAALTRCKFSLEQVKNTIEEKLPLDFWSIDLRGAIQALGEITGEEVTESVLEKIFSRFCIGK
ncbi:MAG TPA: hypothetical protein V6C58_13360, partial [Allocoleopsis sp.]